MCTFQVPEKRTGHTSHQLQYKQQYRLAQGAHITLVCPE